MLVLWMVVGANIRTEVKDRKYRFQEQSIAAFSLQTRGKQGPGGTRPSAKCTSVGTHRMEVSK